MKHNHQVVFGRLVNNCPRCDELREGAPARKGWGYHKRLLERQRMDDIRTHDCKKAGCGVVCTFGDW